jgi:hypothetical protein
VRRIFAAALLAAAACKSGPPPAPAAPPPADAGQPDAGAAQAAPAADAGSSLDEARAAWDRRNQDPAWLDRAISLWEGSASSDPAVLLAVARARRMRMERPGATPEAAEADAQACAAAAHSSWSAGALAPDAGTAPFARVGPAGAEALYLEAVCTAAWSRLQGFTPLIDRRAELAAALTRVAQLAPELDGAGPDRELGVLFAALPAYAGGDLTEARLHLEAAARIAPDEPRNHLVMARTVAVKAQDRALFEKELRMAVASDDTAAAAQAAALLQRGDELFGPAQAAQPTPGGAQK